MENPPNTTQNLRAAREALLRNLGEGLSDSSKQTTNLSSASHSQEDLRNLEKLKQKMGVDFIGAEDWQAIFGKAIGGDFAPSAELISFLNEDCKFVPGKKIHETHMVCFIPETLDGKPYSITELAEMVNDLTATILVYSGSDGYHALSVNDPNERKKAVRYIDKPIKGGRYIALPKEIIKEFLGQNADTQKAVFDANPDKYSSRGYEIGDAGGFSSALIMRYLKAIKGGIEPDNAMLLKKLTFLRCNKTFTSDSRIGSSKEGFFKKLYINCKEFFIYKHTSSAAVGSMNGSSFSISYSGVLDLYKNLTLAVLRNFRKQKE